MVVFVAGIFGLRRFRSSLLADNAASTPEERPAWLDAAIAEHLAKAKSADGDATG
jgi:hypothetical protein